MPSIQAESLSVPLLLLVCELPVLCSDPRSWLVLVPLGLSTLVTHMSIQVKGSLLYTNRVTKGDSEENSLFSGMPLSWENMVVFRLG